MLEFPQIQIDIGNSFFKLRCVTSNSISNIVRLGDKELSKQLLLSLFDVDICDCCVLISCVSNESLLKSVKHFFEAERARSIFIAKTLQSFHGLDLCYQDVTKLGVDRWLVMLASRELSNAEGLCVVDFGTAITADYISTSGRHLGGYIVPGLSLLTRSLQLETANVKFEVNASTLGYDLGQSTSQCVINGINGVIWGIVRLIESQCRKYDCSKVVITGGDAARCKSFFDGHVLLDEGLVFKGLEIAYSQRVL